MVASIKYLFGNPFKLLGFLSVGLMICFNHDSLIVGVSSLGTNLCLVPFILIFALFAWGLLCKHLKINVPAIIIALILCALLLINAIVFSDLRGGYIFIIMGILSAAFICTIYDYHDLIKWFIWWMVFLTVYSLICTYLLKMFVFRGILPIPAVTNSAGANFLNFGLSYVVNIESYFRNFSIFREPGIYQVFLNIAIIFELFARKRKNELWLIILLIGVISTFSSIAYMATVLILLGAVINGFFFERSKDNRRMILLLTFGLFIGVVACLVSPTVLSYLSSSTEKWDVGHSSFYIRFNSILIALNIGLDSPIIGHGITNGIILPKMALMSSVNSLDVTTTWGLMFSCFGGIFAGICAVMSLIMSIKVCRKAWVLPFIAIALMVNSQMLHYGVLYYFTIFIIFSKGSLKKEPKILKADNTKYLNEQNSEAV